MSSFTSMSKKNSASLLHLFPAITPRRLHQDQLPESSLDSYSSHFLDDGNDHNHHAFTRSGPHFTPADADGRCMFPWKLHSMLEAAASEGFQHIVSWRQDNASFKVHDPILFVKDILPRFFRRQRKYKSFQRQLNTWEFERVIGSRGPSNGGYYHRYFHRNNTGMFQLMVLNRRVANKLYDGNKKWLSSLSSIVDKSPSPNLIEEEEDVGLGMETKVAPFAMQGTSSSDEPKSEQWKEANNTVRYDHTTLWPSSKDDTTSVTRTTNITLSQQAVLFYACLQKHDHNLEPNKIALAARNQENFGGIQCNISTPTNMVQSSSSMATLFHESNGCSPHQENSTCSRFSQKKSSEATRLGMDDRTKRTISFQASSQASSLSKNCSGGTTNDLTQNSTTTIMINNFFSWEPGQAHLDKRKDHNQEELILNPNTRGSGSTSFLQVTLDSWLDARAKDSFSKGEEASGLASPSWPSQCAEFRYNFVGMQDEGYGCNHELVEASNEESHEDSQQCRLLLSPDEWKYVRVGMRIAANVD